MKLFGLLMVNRFCMLIYLVFLGEKSFDWLNMCRKKVAKVYRNVLALSKQLVTTLAKQAGWIKTASITFSIEGSYQIAQPMNLLDLSFKMMRYWHQQGGKMGLEQISPDGDDYDKYTGTLNFYYGGYYDKGQPEFDDNDLDEQGYRVPHYNNPNPIVPEQIVKFIEDYMQHDSTVKMRIIKTDDVSGSRDANVVRIQVYENETQDYAELPEMNLSNGNAIALLRLLHANGLSTPVDYGGVINVDELKRVISNIENNPRSLSQHTRPTREYKADDLPLDPLNEPEHTGEPTGDEWMQNTEYEDEAIEPRFNIISFGLDEGQLLSYLNRLQAMIDYIDEHGFGNREITFG